MKEIMKWIPFILFIGLSVWLGGYLIYSAFKSAPKERGKETEKLTAKDRGSHRHVHKGLSGQV